MKIVLFEDSQVKNLFPITTGRPAYAITCASYRLIDWVEQLNVPTIGLVRDYLRTIQELSFPNIKSVNGDRTNEMLFINARVVPSRSSFEVLRTLIDNQRYGIVRAGDVVAAAFVPAGTVELPLEYGDTTLETILDRQEVKKLPTLGSQLKLIDYPHDAVRFNLECFSENLAHRIEKGNYEEISDGVFVAPGAKLGDYFVADTSEGPIVVDSEARVGPYCYFCGPAYIGPRSRIIEHSAIKDAVSLGHTTKIGGEVEASVVEPFTNKQHHGFLGHSYLGSWINLGAGTCNSDLKNTYGEVKMDYGGDKVISGMQFVGCIMGDYSKSAINTGIFTGKTIGTCSMLYGFVTTNVPSFVNYARLFGQTTELPPQVMASTQKRMFKRRSVEQRPCDIQLLYDMYENTHDERRIAGEPLSL